MKRTFATACLGLVLGVACSSGSGGSGGLPGSSSGSFVGNYCSLIEPCCAQAGLSTSGTLCQAFADATASLGTYQSAEGEACIAGMKAESSSGTLCTTLGNDVPSCSLVFSSSNGNVPAGGPCTQDSDCSRSAGGGATCFDNFAFEDGGTTQTETCIQTMVGAAGDGPCVGTVEATETDYEWSGSGPPPASGYTCAVASGLTCDPTTQKCLALATTGQVCDSDSDCVAADYCAFGTSASQCTVRLADGASCASASTGCLTTSYCDGTSLTCKPLLANGASCTVNTECVSQQCVNDVCAVGDDLGLQLLCGTN